MVFALIYDFLIFAVAHIIFKIYREMKLVIRHVFVYLF